MMSLLPKRVMLRRWFLSLRLPLPVLVIDFFWTAIQKSFAKVRPIFLKRAQGDSNMEGGSFVYVPLQTFRQGFKNA